jgi:hypothetical protein
MKDVTEKEGTERKMRRRRLGNKEIDAEAWSLDYKHTVEVLEDKEDRFLLRSQTHVCIHKCLRQ